MKIHMSSLLLFVAILVLAACGGQANEQNAPLESNQIETGVSQESIEVAMNDIYFGASNDNVANPPIWTVTSGAEVSVNMDNNGALEHNWAIVKADTEVSDIYDEATDQDKLLFNAGVLSSGETQTVDFTAPLPGEYKVICTVPGHSPVMQGQLVVN